MKNLILIFYFLCFASIAAAQIAPTDTTLKFDKAITFYEKHWVVLQKPGNVPYYTFGFVYIQSDKGFMFKPAGQFEIAKNGKYVLRNGKLYPYKLNAGDADEFKGSWLIRFRDTIGGMNPKPKRVTVAALLPSTHFKELNIEAEPQWLKPYDVYTDTLEHNYRWGCYHYEELDCDTGIAYLEKVYQVSPHYKGVRIPMDNADWINHQGIELKLSAAYNNQGYRDTGFYDKAILVLNNAILNNPVYVPFYQELINTYMKKSDWKMVVETAKKGLATLTTVEKSDQKRDLAACVAYGYEELKNDEQGKYWRQKSLDYSLHPGLVY